MIVKHVNYLEYQDSRNTYQKSPDISQFPSRNINTQPAPFPKTAYRRLHLPVNACAQNMFSRDVKRMSFRCQTLKFSRPNVKFRNWQGNVFSQQEWKKLSKRRPTFKWFAESSRRSCPALFFFQKLGDDYASARAQFQISLNASFQFLHR